IVNARKRVELKMKQIMISDVCVKLVDVIGTFSNSVFFFNNSATAEIYTLSLHDALPIFNSAALLLRSANAKHPRGLANGSDVLRSEEHTSELQSLAYLVCRLLLEKKKW